MSALNLSDSNITHRKHIVQLLQMAIDQKWRFSYVQLIRNHVETRPIQLRAVRAEEGMFEVDQNIERSVQNFAEPITFRAQTGGISVMFKAQIAPARKEQVVPVAGGYYQFAIPYEVGCTQLRRSIRLNVEIQEEPVAVAVYLAMGVQMEGELIDISTTGAQISIRGDQTERLRNPQILEACRISLTEDYALRCGAQLLGVNFDINRKLTLLRCQFIDVLSQDEDKLEAYINSALEQADSSTIVISS